MCQIIHLCALRTQTVKIMMFCVKVFMLLCITTVTFNVDFVYTQKCVTITQIGDSVRLEPSKLKCTFDSGVVDPLTLRWESPNNGRAANLVWFSDGPDITIDDEDKYDCEWNNGNLESTLTIKNTSINDDGRWTCTLSHVHGYHVTEVMMHTTWMSKVHNNLFNVLLICETYVSEIIENNK